MSIKENARYILDNIPESVTLVAAVKYATEESIKESYDAGIRHFGFNTYQQMEEIAPKLEKDAKIHYIGTLQTRNIKKILELKPDLIQSVDSEKKAGIIDRIAKDQDRIQDILIQINTDENKDSGIRSEDLDSLMTKISTLENIRVLGLMTVPPATEDESKLDSIFLEMRRLFENLKHKFNDIDYLSMGMSADYRAAIESGSTMVRIGSSIFKD